jgi:hypothetical protein
MERKVYSVIFVQYAQKTATNVALSRNNTVHREKNLWTNPTIFLRFLTATVAMIGKTNDPC